MQVTVFECTECQFSADNMFYLQFAFNNVQHRNVLNADTNKLNYKEKARQFLLPSIRIQ